MSAERSRPGASIARWLSVSLLLAFFFLPFHVHIGSAVASQATKECVCLHGSRLQAEFTAASASCAVLIVIGEVAPAVQISFASLSIVYPFSRAPPQVSR